ncbi:hypothetical protein [Streptomyces sp. NRRL F-5135]|uniref:hypothetical protein n=1 Tax=Streptomyces sp. NRRL F-5135 TaxID=1463858 RepID=UPI0004C5EDC6|nr:hypothetical protein [Streptomyces sp. NRRL F-5135]
MAADRIQVTRQGTHASVVVDGTEIPAQAILANSVTVDVDPGDIPSVRLTLIGAQVDVLNTIHTQEQESKTP